MNFDDILTVVVPVGKSHDGLELLRIWIGDSLHLPMRTILVIDTEDDNTIESAYKIQRTVPNKVQILSTSFKGPGSARNLGLSIVATEWVCFWDSDDLAYPKIALNLIKEADKGGFGAAIGNYKIYKNNVESLSLPDKKSYSALDLAVDPGLWRFFFRYEKIRFITFPEMFMGEDLVFLAKCADALEDAFVSSKVTYRYTKNTKFQLTSSNQYISQLHQAGIILGEIENSLKSNYGKEFLNFLKIKIFLTLLKRGTWDVKLKTIFNLFKITSKAKDFRKIRFGIIYLLRTIRN